MPAVTQQFPPDVSLPVLWDATGSGLHATGSSTTITTTGTHTAAAGAYVSLWVSVFVNNGTTTSVTATYGGTTMPSLKTIHHNNSATSGEDVLFGLATPATGLQTISLSASASVAVSAIVACTVSYLNVGSVNPITTNVGYSTSMSVSATNVANGIAAACLGAAQTTGLTISGFNKTQRYARSSTGSDAIIVIGDSDAVGAQNFAATLTGTSPYWAGIGAVFNPAA